MTPTRMELVGASGRMAGGGFTLDMQLGHSRLQGPMDGGTVTLGTGAAVKP